MKRNLLIPFILLAACIIYACNNGDYDANPKGTSNIDNPVNPGNLNSYFRGMIDSVAFTGLSKSLTSLDSMPTIYASDGNRVIALMLDSFKYEKGIFPIDEKHRNVGLYYKLADSANIHFAKRGSIDVSYIDDSGKFFYGTFYFETNDSIKVNGEFGFY